jgi:hypothetical protein
MITYSDTGYKIYRSNGKLVVSAQWEYDYPVTVTKFPDGSALHRTSTHGVIHREDGPAVENRGSIHGANLPDNYYLHGELLSKIEYDQWLKAKKSFNDMKARYSASDMSKQVSVGADKLGSSISETVTLKVDAKSDFLPLEKELQAAFSKEELVSEPTWPEENVVDYAKYQKQIKERAEEFIKAFDAERLAASKKEEEKQKILKIEELTKKVEELTKERIAKKFGSAPPLDIHQLNRYGFNVSLKDFLSWSNVGADHVKNAFLKFLDTGLELDKALVSDHIFIANSSAARRTVEEQAKANLIKEDLAKKDKDIEIRIPGSYNEMSDFVGRLVNINAIDRNDFITQMSKCERWSDSDHITIAQRISSYFKGDMTATLSEIKTLVSKANDKVLEKDIPYFIDTKDIPLDPHAHVSKKEAKNIKEIEKINRLLANGKIQIKDLDKYVALGIITNSGLKAWRIQDQANNNYFYSDFDSSQDEGYTITDNDQILLNDLFDRFGETKFESEVHKAACRIAGKQLNNITRTAIIKSLPKDKAEGIKDFLSSELGNSFVSMIGGVTLTYAMESNDTAQKLAKELRVSGITTLGNEAVNTLMGGIFDVIKNTVADLPESQEIDTENEIIEEDFALIQENEKERNQMLN